MGRAMNYDAFAPRYAHTRWAVPWIVDPLVTAAGVLAERSTIVDVGCGTGNYVIALHDALPQHDYRGFDISDGMLEVARSRSDRIAFAKGDAAHGFPCPDECCDLAFAVDVIHHIERIDVFFREASRILKPQRRLLVVTDSEENIRSRSLTRHFPETLEIELDRYPRMRDLDEAAADADLRLVGREAAEGNIPLDDDFIAKLEAKCSSSLRLISSEAHKKGIESLREAGQRGEQWFSCYTVVKYEKQESGDGGDERAI